MDENKNKKKSKKRFPIVAVIIIIACAVVLVIALYNIIKIQMEYKHINDTNDSITSSIVASDSSGNSSNDDGLGINYDHAAALAINKDAKGLFYEPANDIKLPIVQYSDNDYYLHRDFYGDYSLGGTIFIDSNITDGINANYVLIYGHHMNNGTMFTKNNNYKDESFYKKSGNDVFYIFTGTSIRKYTIFSVFNVDPYDSSVYRVNYSESQIKKNISDWKKRSIYDTGVDVSNATQVVTLSSCEATDYNYRLVVMGTLTEETPYKK